ncbi:ParB N-terminal domain-containing protein [Candidatus Pacearchaeota archaeon]|nr:ParB N-terminal domain-containing protein [Candidatus Pacearchaeota archaeon]
MKVQTKKVKLSAIKLNPDNPRKISIGEMDRLIKSLADFPEMMQLREIVVDENMVILGGNMRYQALKKSKAKDCTIKIVEGLTGEQKREFVIKDNSNFGEYDWELIESGWDDLPLGDWGVNLPDDFGGSPDFEPGTEDDQGQLDQKEPTICPECGHSWVK